MLDRIIQIVCVLLLIGVIYGVGQGYLALASFFTPDFHVGFICGGLLIFLIWWIGQKLDKSSGR